MTVERVSVIIPVYNRPAMVAEAVGSALAQDGVEVEVVVVDDGSTDSTPEVVDGLAASDPRVVALHQTNAGPARARNVGVAASRSEWVAFLDSDDLMLPDRLRTQIDALRDHPSAGAVIGLERVVVADGVEVPTILAQRPTAEVRPLWFMMSVLLSRSTFAATGGFDDSVRHGDEDTEWFDRLTDNCTVIRLPVELTLRRITGDNLSYGTDTGRLMLELARRRLDRRRSAHPPGE